MPIIAVHMTGPSVFNAITILISYTTYIPKIHYTGNCIPFLSLRDILQTDLSEKHITFFIAKEENIAIHKI